MSEFANSAGHWYALDGSPRYTMTGKNGAQRAVTLRDAKVHALVPSVTSIIRCAAAPGLERWKRQQMLLATVANPRHSEESEDEWFKRVENASNELGRSTAAEGTRIHGAIELHYRGEPYDPRYAHHVTYAVSEIARKCDAQAWMPERSFAHEYGYGGKCDLHSQEWVIDVKTKDGDMPAGLYDEHLMQLAAYRRGLNVPKARCAILYSHRQSGEAVLLEAPQSELNTGLVMFDALLEYWQAKNQHYPMRKEAA